MTDAAEPSAPRAARDEPLGLVVHSLPAASRAFTDGPLARRRGRLMMIGVLLLCAAPVIASYFLYYVARPSAGATAYGTLIQPTRPMPAVDAVDLDGRAAPLRDLAGQWLLVAVGSGACDADCERRLYTQRQLREMLGRERDRLDKVWLVVDDAPVAPALRAALEATPAMHVRRVPRAVVERWLAPAAGQALESHLYVVDPLGEWMMREPATPDPAKVKRDLDKLLRASASWDQAGRQALKPAAPRPAPEAAR